MVDDLDGDLADDLDDRVDDLDGDLDNRVDDLDGDLVDRVDNDHLRMRPLPLLAADCLFLWTNVATSSDNQCNC